MINKLTGEHPATTIDRLPRELVPGVFWLGKCFENRSGELFIHAYHSVYVVNGSEAALLVDTGFPKDWGAVDRQLDELIDRGLSPVRYLLPTHVEVPHSGNLGRLLVKFLDAVAIGDVRDYHLVFPQFADRLRGTAVGDEVDLGGRTVRILDAPFHDSLTTQWAYDVQGKTLFTADGFAFLHWHGRGECAKATEEIAGMPLAEFTAHFGESAFSWMRFVDISTNLAHLTRLLDGLEVDVIAPGHGCPIIDPAKSVPQVVEGMLLGQRVPRSEIAARLTRYAVGNA